MRHAISFIATLALAGSLQAAVVSTLGDRDCFGLGGSCPDGSLFVIQLGGSFFTNYQTGTDPSFTDTWDAPGSISFTHTYAIPPGAVSATLEMRIAGIHDNNLGTIYDLLVNGNSVGVIPDHPGANTHQEVVTYSFNVPVGLLTGSDTISVANLGSDGFIIDYAELSVESSDVPEPSSLALLGTALVAARLRMRRVRPN